MSAENEAKNGTGASGGGIPDVPSEARSPFMLAMQFFLIPLGIVAACVLVFLLFGVIAVERKSSDDYLKEITSSDFNRRWQAAFELSKLISQDETLRGNREFAKRLTDVFRSTAADPDPRVRGYLALALGHLQNAEAVPALVEALGDSSPDTVLYSAWSLGTIGDKSAVPPLMGLAAHHDGGVRKMAAYSLGQLGDVQAADTLTGMLEDEVPDVRWNAALALAALGDGRSKPMLFMLLSPGYLQQVTEATESQKVEARLAAVWALGHFKGDDVRAVLEDTRQHDANVSVQAAAAQVLQNFP